MKRPIVGGEYSYRGYPIRVELMTPDYLLFVDDIQIGQFWLDPLSADAEARRNVEQKEREKEREQKAKEMTHGN